MVSLTSFEVVRYRGIDGLCLPRLTRINLITGANGVGKTALLEAIWLFANRFSPSLLWSTAVQRPATIGTTLPANPISRLSKGDLQLQGIESGEQHSMKLSFQEAGGTVPHNLKFDSGQQSMQSPQPVVGIVHRYLDGKIPDQPYTGLRMTPLGAVLHQPDAAPGRPRCIFESTGLQQELPIDHLARFSQLIRDGQRPQLLQAMKLAIPGINGIEILLGDGGAYLAISLADGNTTHLQDLGSGTMQLARQVLGFSTSRNGILLSDEMGSVMHHSALGDFWDKIIHWTRLWNVQYFAATHSAEFIDTALAAFSCMPGDLSVHKLFYDEGTGLTGAATFSGDALEGVRSLNMEIR